MAKTEKHIGNTEPSICYDCELATGGCCWSELDDKGKAVRFQLPEGAVAETVPYNSGAGGWTTIPRICACPLFKPDRGYDVEEARGFNRMLDALEKEHMAPSRAAKENGFPSDRGYYWNARLKKEGTLQPFKRYVPEE